VLFQQIAWGTGEMAVDFQDLHARVDVLHADQGDAAFVRAYGFKLHTVGHQRQRLMLDFSAIQLLTQYCLYSDSVMCITRSSRTSRSRAWEPEQTQRPAGCRPSFVFPRQRSCASRRKRWTPPDSAGSQLPPHRLWAEVAGRKAASQQQEQGGGAPSNPLLVMCFRHDHCHSPLNQNRNASCSHRPWMSGKRRRSVWSYCALNAM